MKPLGPEREHYWLAKSMASTNGVDLQSAIEEGAFSQHDWSELVTQCRGCTWVGGCKRWLQQHQGLDGVEEGPPQQCPNAGTFEMLLELAETQAEERS